MNRPIRERAVQVHRAILSAVFLAAGVGKLAGASAMAQVFVHFGLEYGFMHFIGVCEVAGAIGLFMPRVAWLAAVGLAMVMLGATWQHAMHDPVVHALPPLVLLALCTHVGHASWIERPQAAAVCPVG